MKRIDGYISELLFSHECVIIPGFGGFITSYAPARIHSSQILQPPSKDILFNAQLNRNDGLLANYIAAREYISYEEATALIHQFTTECHSRLNKNEPVIFEQIGTFTTNEESNLVFSPLMEMNYLEDAYGLPKLVLPPVTRDLKKPAALRSGYNRTEKHHPETRKVVRRLAFALLLIAAIGWWGIYHSTLFRDIYTHYSGIMPLIKATHETPGPAAEGKSESRFTAREIQVPADQPTTSPNEEKVEEVTDTEVVSQPAPSGKYCIIAGAFKEKENAVRLIDRLCSQGFNAKEAGRTNGGLYLVSYGNFVTEKEALQSLENIRISDNPNAWLFIK